MKFQDISKKSAEDLLKLLAEKREELRELRFKLAANQLKDVRLVRETKQMIAQIQTRLTQINAEDQSTKN